MVRPIRRRCPAGPTDNCYFLHKSVFFLVTMRSTVFSPHTWGCTGVRAVQRVPLGVFPAHVGMYLRQRDRLRWSSLFPAHVGMYPTPTSWSPRRLRFPRIRGDVPLFGMYVAWDAPFSPHTWGCTPLAFLDAPFVVVFPAHVGMYPRRSRLRRRGPCFPRIRGDVPVWLEKGQYVDAFSPHTWGCTERVGVNQPPVNVFPAHAGMYPVSFRVEASSIGFSL